MARILGCSIAAEIMNRNAMYTASSIFSSNVLPPRALYERITSAENRKINATHIKATAAVFITSENKRMANKKSTMMLSAIELPRKPLTRTVSELLLIDGCRSVTQTTSQTPRPTMRLSPNTSRVSEPNLSRTTRPRHSMRSICSASEQV